MSTSASARYEDGPEAVSYSQLEVVPRSTKETYYYNNATASQPLDDSNDTPSPPGTKKSIFGLRRITFFLLLALVIAVAGIAIAGAVLGSRLASHSGSHSSNDSLSSETATSTEASNYSAPTSVTLALDCERENPIEDPWADGGTISYDVTCNKDCGYNDIFPIWAYSLSHCMIACKNFNNNIPSADIDMECVGVVFRADMSKVDNLEGNCFLKQDCSQFQTKYDMDIAYAIFT